MSPAVAPTRLEQLRTILYAARDAGGPAPSRAELASTLGVDRSNVSRLLLQLEERGDLPCAPRGPGLRRTPRTLPEKLTTRQAEILAFVGGYVAEHQRPPTTREICAHFDFGSPSAALAHLRALARKGRLTLDPKTARNLRVVDPHAIPLELIGRVLGFAYRHHLGEATDGGAKRLREGLRELVAAWPDFARRVGAI